MPRLLADENIQAPLVAALRKAGHDVVYVAEGASGITDETVVAMAVEGHRYLLTEDKDFGALVFRLKRGLPDVLWESRYRRLLTLFSHHEQRLENHYVVVGEDRIRFRPMP